MQPSKRPHHRASRWRGSQIGVRGSHPEGSRNSARPLLPLTVRGSGGLGFRHTVHLGRPSERTPSGPPGRYARRALRSRILFGVLLVLGLLSSATYATSGARVSPVRQWAIVNFDSTTAVSGALLNAGRYLIVHQFESPSPGAVYFFSGSTPSLGAPRTTNYRVQVRSGLGRTRRARPHPVSRAQRGSRIKPRSTELSESTLSSS